ncbi:MAG: FtsQ-type POTRA domain-containing protein [bacterium]|nr:FtsQ-type POTRA domain-containing protein [bacterium]
MLQNSLFHRFLRKYNKIFIFLTFIFIGLAFLYIGKNIFVIRKIQIFGINPKISIIGLSGYQNTNLILLHEKSVEKNIFNQNSMIKTIHIDKKFPDTLQVTVSMYIPIAYTESSIENFILSSDGRILKKSKEVGDLPLIHYYQKLNKYSFGIGEYISYKDMLYALYFLDHVMDFGVRFNRIDINGFNMLLCKVDDKEIIFTAEKSKETQLYELEQIIKQFKVEGRNYKRIDLRFDKPVVAF